MKHFASPEFWAAYRRLPDSVRTLADKNFVLLKSDPQHPSLHFKQIGRYYSARVGLRYRGSRNQGRRRPRVVLDRLTC